MVAALVTSTLSPGRSSSSARRRWRPRTATGSRPARDELVEDAGSCGVRRPASRRPPGRSGRHARSPGVPSTSTVSKCPDHCASSRSGKSSRQCEPRVSSRSRGRVGQRRAHGDQVGGLPGVLVDRRVGVADQRLQLVQRGRRARSPSAARRPRRSSRSGARGVRRRSTRPGRAGVGGRLRPRGAARPGSTSAIRREKTSPSSSELEASRLAPCTPEQATSPVA